MADQQKTTSQNKTDIAGRSREGQASFENKSQGSGTGAAAAKSLYDQAKETASSAYEAATDKAATKLDEQKTNLSSGLSSVADSVRQVGENIRTGDGQTGFAQTAAQYSNTAAQKIEAAANYFERKDIRGMLRDTEEFARRNPAVFIGVALGLGFLAARFLKSNSADYNEAGAGLSFDTAAASGERNELRSQGTSRQRTSTKPSTGNGI